MAERQAQDYLFIGGPLHGKTRRTDGAIWFTAVSDHGRSRTDYRMETVAIRDLQRTRRCYVANGVPLELALTMLHQWLLEQWVLGGPPRCIVPDCEEQGTQAIRVGGRGIRLTIGWFDRGTTLLLCMQHWDELVNAGAPGYPPAQWIGTFAEHYPIGIKRDMGYTQSNPTQEAVTHGDDQDVTQGS